MKNLSSLKKQPVGLRLPRYMIQEIDHLAHQFELKRSDIITEAISSYIEEQKSRVLYAEFDQASEELKKYLTGGSHGQDSAKEKTLNNLINELENNHSEQL